MHRPLQNGSSVRAVSIDLLLLLLAWVVAVAAAHPTGNFPLNDDWSYAETVRHLVEHREFRPGGWTAMPLFTTALWGSLFCLPAGFSFSALRLSTLTTSLLGIFGVYFLMREIRASRRIAMFAALVAGLNPVYFALSNTFMIDVHFATMMTFAVFGFVRHIQSGKTGFSAAYWAGTGFVVAAILSRQLALAVPMAFSLAILVRSPFSLKRASLALFPTLLAAAVLKGFEHWMKISGKLPALYDIKTDGLVHGLGNLRSLAVTVVNNTVIVSFYLGLFLLPLLVLAAPALFKDRKKRPLLVFLGTAALLAAWNAAIGWRLMPLAGNVLVPSGLGTPTLRDAEILRLANLPGISPGFWIAVSILSITGAAFLAAFLAELLASLTRAPFSRRRGTPSRVSSPDAQEGDRETLRIFLLLTVAIYLAPLLLSHFFDRYLIVVAPFLAAALLIPAASASAQRGVTGASVRLVACTLLGLFAAYAVAGTRDYFAWNRARWNALTELAAESRIPPEKIDGGFEFNGLFLYDPAYQPPPEKSWWWVRDDRYLVSFGPVPGYRPLREYPYGRILPPGTGKIIVSERLGDPNQAPPAPVRIPPP